MSLPPGLARKLPIVYATSKAIDEAVRVMPGLVVENAVRDALRTGGLVHRDRGRNLGTVIAPTWRATVRRAASPVTGRKSWLVTEITPRRPAQRKAA